MKFDKLSRRLLVLALCVACALLPGAGLLESVSAAVSKDNLITQVRVGLCLPEKNTGVFVSSALCTDGFMVGAYRASDRSFIPSFGLSARSLAILPDRNASLTLHEDGTVGGKASDSGNRGAYNLTDGKLYPGYSAALTAASKKADGFVACTDGGYQVRFGSYKSAAEAQAAAGKSYRVASPTEGGIALVDGKTGKTLLEYECSVPLAVRSKNGSEVSLNTVSSRHGYLGFFVFYATSRMKVINVVDMETYTKCVMSNEIGTNATVETRRAFSVLVRTVALHASKHQKQGADVCYTTCCQVYLGTYRRSAENDAIVDSTKGQYVAYRGEPISCLYHNSNGGASCSSVAAWGGSEIPYLTSVTLKEDKGNISEMWQYTFTRKELYDFLSSRDAFKGLEGGIHDVSIRGTDPYGSGYVTLLSVTDRYGNAVSIKTSEKVRTALRFQSANFTVSYSATAQVVGAGGAVSSQSVGGYVDANGKYVEFDSFARHEVAGSEDTFGAEVIQFDGVGVGHGVGFSSNGSEQLAGQGYSYRYIIQFYFAGTEILDLYH